MPNGKLWAARLEICLWRRCPSSQTWQPASTPPAEWVRVPNSCPGLAAALPAVLRRSTDEAGLLVRRLPPTDRERLRVAALCLVRVQRLHGLELPAELLHRLLLVAEEG